VKVIEESFGLHPVDTLEIALAFPTYAPSIRLWYRIDVALSPPCDRDMRALCTQKKRRSKEVKLTKRRESYENKYSFTFHAYILTMISGFFMGLYGVLTKSKVNHSFVVFLQLVWWF